MGASRKKKYPEMMGAKEASAAIGCRQSNLRMIAGLPKPVQELASTTLWDAEEIRAFARERNARRYRPEARTDLVA
jgi:hypothetical protein